MRRSKSQNANVANLEYLAGKELIFFSVAIFTIVVIEVESIHKVKKIKSISILYIFDLSQCGCVRKRFIKPSEDFAPMWGNLFKYVTGVLHEKSFAVRDELFNGVILVFLKNGNQEILVFDGFAHFIYNLSFFEKNL